MSFIIGCHVLSYSNDHRHCSPVQWRDIANSKQPQRHPILLAGGHMFSLTTQLQQHIPLSRHSFKGGQHEWTVLKFVPPTTTLLKDY